MKYIGIGNCNKYNIYLLIGFLCLLLKNCLLGLNSANKEKPARIFPFKAKIKDHKLLDNFIQFSSIIFGGVILYFFQRRNHLKKNDEVSIQNYEKIKEILNDNKYGSILFNLILIGILFPLAIIFEDFTNLAHSNISFWSLEIFNIGIISYLIFKNEIYRHKKLAIYIMFFVTIIIFIDFFIPSTKHENSENKNELTDKNAFEIAIIKYGFYSIPLLLIANELRHIQRDYCWLNMKYLMDIKSLPPYKIFLVIGSIGIVFIIILFSIFTFVPCKTFNGVDKNGNNYFYNNTGEPLKLYLEYCSLKNYDENTKELYLYYDSLKLISREYSNTDKDNMLEIFLLIPSLFLVYSISNISNLIIIRYFDPNNILIYRYFYYFVKNIILIILNEGDEQYMRHDKFIIKELENFAGIICGLVYIEMLELKFCKLDYELKKNIDRRGTEDIIGGFNFNDNESEGNEIDFHENKILDDIDNINP